ncbi:mitochondrial carrier domain-containing protein [Roridomyces roridus]|uniref:Mitochondrial carrier domain-containing protein n=1 Tax=Roridomyces roridus TaxID=1738132 RepID=A0AAD7FZA2_9AGAR|nr:mitochondrial carrier domain-containing protein [Roridomyces roridus]
MAQSNTSIPSSDSPAAHPTPQPRPPQHFLSPEIATYFLAGGIAGATSRTVVSPLERLKIIQQIQPRNSAQNYQGVFRSLVRMWKEEGFRGYLRGNGINCLRIFPYSAVQFTTYEQLKKWFSSHGSRELDTPKRLLAGACAGICSVSSTYPLDLVRARLSIATASIALTISPQAKLASATSSAGKLSLSSAYHTASSSLAFSPADLTVLGMTKKILREEGGIRGLYRGVVATAIGVAPYVGLNFALHNSFREILTPPGKNTVARKLTCGALAGAISQALTYPFDVVRRKMQVSGMKASALDIKYTGAVDAVRGILRTEGIVGLYRGLWPNLLKVRQSVSAASAS